MIPQKLIISGFLSYQEPVEIDFSALHVACISGQNGAGKSSMLDAMTWALFGEARQNDDGILNDALGKRRAEVILDFVYESALYRIDRVKEIAKSSSVDFFIFDESSSQWKALTEKTVTGTNKRIRDVLHMDYKTFINASFFLQGKADEFTNQNATERKQVLSNILDLDIWEKYKERAVEKRKTASYQLASIEAELEENEKELAEEDQRRADLLQIDALIKSAEEKRLLATQKWQNARDAEQILLTQRKTVKDLQSQDNALFLQINKSKQTLSERQIELDKCKACLADEQTVEKNYASLLEARDKLAELNKKATKFYQLDKNRTELMNTIEREDLRMKGIIQALLREEEVFQSRQADIPVKQAGLNTLLSEIEKLQTQCETKPQLISNRDELMQTETTKRAENLRLKKEMHELRAHIDTLKQQLGGLCPVCGRDMDEAHCTEYAGQLEKEGKELAVLYHTNEDEVRVIETHKAETNAAIKQIEVAENELLRLEKKAAPLRAQLELAKNESQKWLTDGALRLQEARSTLESPEFCANEKSALEQLAVAINANAYDEAQHKIWLDKENALSDAEKARQEIVQARGMSGPLEREIVELGKQIQVFNQDWLALRENIDKQEKQLQTLVENLPDMAQSKLVLDAAQSEENMLRGRKGRIEQLVAVLDSLKVSQQRLRKSRTENVQLIDHLKLLEKAFGKNGIPALLIEQALPEIEEQANILLSRLSNDKMSLRFDTLREYKDKKKEEKRETLDIKISDDYGTRAYELFSGGESFRINFAIRLALSRMLARRSGSRLQTLVIDEGFGSQDAEGRTRLIEAITEVQDDFEKILVITHLDELKEAFPSRIEVEKTLQGSKVEVYP